MTAALALVTVVGPALAALLIAVVLPVRRRGHLAAAVAITASALDVVVAAMLAAWDERLHVTVPWLVQEGRVMAEVGLHLDAISSVMLVVVGVVALLVQIFSVGYIADEPSVARGRYFGYHALFLLAMNVLVLAPNLLQLFLGWELVGVASYLLIGFYFARPAAARAAVKAFWVTKLADVGLFLGLLVLWTRTGTFSWAAPLSATAAAWVAGLLFLAVMGKSAQFPLHVWLPDAMEGPTPVSALLHAATMVAAGVYLVVRAEPIFMAAPAVQTLMLWVGTTTAVFAAGLALVQTDIKKVLAYSTCSQLGYMVAALGAGDTLAGFFHLSTHAFFKSLLFLAAGSLIHAVHSNELADMGGLWRRMPVTFAAFGLGALALSGVPPLSGFFSKDLVLAAVEGKGGWIPWAALMCAAFLTSLYMGRTVIAAFFGSPRGPAAHAHESGPSMAGPLVVLLVPTLSAGLAQGWLGGLLGRHVELHLGLTPVTATLAGLGGWVAAWIVFRGPEPAFVVALRSFARRGLVDRAWLAGYGAALGVGRLAGWIDRHVVDGLMNAVGASSLILGARARSLQTGRARDYILALGVGMVLLLAWGAWS